MKDEIIKTREELVNLSKDPIKTRELLDKLTEEEIEKHDLESEFHIGKNEITETKDYDHYVVHKTKNGYLLHYRGGYKVFVDDKLLSPANAMQMLLDGVDGITDDTEKIYRETANSAVEMVFRLPLFVFGHPATTYNIATIGLQYLLLLQKMSEVPTEETENPEFDKAMQMIQEIVDNAIKGLEKEGREYERRMGIDNGKETEKEQVEDKSESEN